MNKSVRPDEGVRILNRILDKLYVGEPMVETIGLRETPALWTWDKLYNWGGDDACVGSRSLLFFGYLPSLLSDL